MKRYLLILTLLFALNSNAQQTVSIPPLNDKAIVKDTEGNVVPYVLWMALHKSGDYSIRYIKDKSEFLIYLLTPEQKIKVNERRAEMNAKLPRPRLSGSFKDGEKFTGYKLTDINGNKYDIRNAVGKVIVLNFWFINCPPCKAEIPDLNNVFTQYKDNKDVIFLAIALDEKYDLKEFTKKSPFLYNIIPSGRFYTEKHDVKSYPTHVIVGKDGLVKFHTTGLASNTVFWIEKTIKDELAAI
ncbi:TlpA family protein disulfide reductase [Pedobacter insulae]|uniref:Thiol-disulfide isomerase or thioredoxin n=1 Tax=Pedobacter insulae TaxID=414048 RepID=A0A1I3AKS1_9SPHI|nr:TlpA disulfide reductase family protein [Pedobacter insulae]SFH50406.1 Thiol-disulfide isomerase or thioredoxin [Pedobacter insulae]